MKKTDSNMKRWRLPLSVTACRTLPFTRSDLSIREAREALRHWLRVRAGITLPPGEYLVSLYDLGDRAELFLCPIKSTEQEKRGTRFVFSSLDVLLMFAKRVNEADASTAVSPRVYRYGGRWMLLYLGEPPITVYDYAEEMAEEGSEEIGEYGEVFLPSPALLYLARLGSGKSLDTAGKNDYN